MDFEITGIRINSLILLPSFLFSFPRRRTKNRRSNFLSKKDKSILLNSNLPNRFENARSKPRQSISLTSPRGIARGRPLKKRTDNPGCGIESTSLKTRRQRRSNVGFLFSSLSSSINHLPLPIDHSILIPFLYLSPLSPPPTRVSYTHTHVESLLWPSEMHLFSRFSSRNQRYKYARLELLVAYSKGRRRISWRDLIHSRARFRGIAGAKMILLRPRRTRLPFQPFPTNRTTFLFSHQNPSTLFTHRLYTYPL